MNRYLIISKNWLGYAAVVTLLCFLVYIVAQQNFRQSANDSQYQLAKDAANAINKGTDPKTVGSTAALDIASTLSPYLLVFDTNGAAISHNITLDGETPKLPEGALNSARGKASLAVTWQPRPGVRQAMVIISTRNGYTVVAGRSLQITEDHIATLGSQVLFGWIASLVAMLVIVGLQDLITSKMGLA